MQCLVDKEEVIQEEHKKDSIHHNSMFNNLFLISILCILLSTSNNRT